jgi:general secretion pathway protein G
LPRRRGFTLIEVLLVLVILVILASFAVMQFGGVRDDAQIDQAKTQIGLFKTGLELYELKFGDFPATNEGLEALRTGPANSADTSNWKPLLDTQVPLDPWGNPYQYSFPGTHNPNKYDLWSMGPDGQEGTSDDIGNWE